MKSYDNYSQQHLVESVSIIKAFDVRKIESLVEQIATLRAERGRIFFLGVGGSAANCSHAVNDFRKLIGVECYSGTDNVAELTARTNDDGWENVFADWLLTCNPTTKDALMIFSVGGGSIEKRVSANLVKAIDIGKQIGMKVFGIVGRDGGYTKANADECITVPVVNPENITPHSEAMQAVIWHLIVSHPKLKKNPPKWESISDV